MVVAVKLPLIALAALLAASCVPATEPDPWPPPTPNADRWPVSIHDVAAECESQAPWIMMDGGPADRLGWQLGREWVHWVGWDMRLTAAAAADLRAALDCS